MPREAELSLNEREFLLQALGENVRLDGRAFDAFRDLDLTFGDEYGVADVRLGKTRYVFDTLDERYALIRLQGDCAHLCGGDSSIR